METHLKILEKIEKDHRRVATLFDRLGATRRGSEKLRAELCRKIVHELRAHAQFEEQVFYPVLRTVNDEAEDLVGLAVEEHGEFDRMLQRIENMDAKDDGFMVLLGQLRRWVEDHVEEEENDIFPFARQGIEQATSKDMARLHDTMVRRYLRSAAE